MLEHEEDLAKIITWENGKIHTDAAGEVLFAAGHLEWYSEEAARLYGEVIPHSSPNTTVQVVKEPIGVCGLITPWNFPAGMVTRKVAPALAAGCTVIIKTDGLTPFTANALAVLAQRAGVPKGVINILTALENTPSLGLALCKSDVVRKLSFTGSTRVGQLLAEQAGSSLKKLSLELGGNAPFIVYDDADLDIAVACCMASKFKSSGQTCVCTNRIFVQNRIFDAFTQRLAHEIKKLWVGVANDPGSDIGPLISTRAVAKVDQHIQDAVEKGARLVVGGQRLPLGKMKAPLPLYKALCVLTREGDHFIQPTLLIGLNETMKIAHEETFGPLAGVFRFTTEEEVIERANDSAVGLAAYIMTNDLGRAQRTAERLHTGMVAINTGAVSDPAVP